MSFVVTSCFCYLQGKQHIDFLRKLTQRILCTMEGSGFHEVSHIEKKAHVTLKVSFNWVKSVIIITTIIIITIRIITITIIMTRILFLKPQLTKSSPFFLKILAGSLSPLCRLTWTTWMSRSLIIYWFVVFAIIFKRSLRRAIPPKCGFAWRSGQL